MIMRDDKPGIDFPAHWDFPGGGRDEGETGYQTAAREMREEVGLDLDRAEILWRRRLPSDTAPGRDSWFFVAQFPAGAVDDIRFGDEGQFWRLMPVEEVLALPQIVPSLALRLRLWLDFRAGGN
ncbi:NUDIX hydrolase [Ponticoccus sp. SC2-23]|nr:NUDIX hydrolase [Ponticoccus sp. SC6-9]MBM1225143.1 NUDIX hydrolase [Ponticoccus sp. SC6-15]MBM1228657.1 NUDIX hydrolase [Ponticoccus sp. SC6-38]MBM1233706.1 NUDIX hydrolase [Ponticoccus sp. SC6-45]MBM1239158.1 NUDIX hydrolase [Ponticoccus sp. SC6-49]MBM1242940.1 NUDIX hydrolase [Ponticoccus sp. SC2-64]MBM1247230.1 NUDIX hydrolase [Ponticoccus sp. SC6-42]MBM1252111.1 NUDIX hydrolase [Ponticoccus sp. SC6-33]MBM1257167.1 NUDIX hydrolase [Ponticoccus sp. SC6-60]MBM1260719.1 NUDIX hydrolase